MTAIIKLLGEILALAVLMHRPDMPLGRGVSGDEIHDWTRALVDLRADMERAVRDGGA